MCKSLEPKLVPSIGEPKTNMRTKNQEDVSLSLQVSNILKIIKIGNDIRFNHSGLGKLGHRACHVGRWGLEKGRRPFSNPQPN